METILTAAAAIVILGIVLLIVWLAHQLASYLCKSIGLMTLAKRRGIRMAWLSWLPVGELFILGALADRHESLLTGRKERMGRAMVWLTVLGKALTLAGQIWSLVSGAVTAELAITATGLTAIGILVWLVGRVVSMLGTVCSVFEKVCLYQVFDSCDPRRKVLYLMLSLFLGSGYFLFLCRNRDLGIPQTPAVPQAPEEEEELPPAVPPVIDAMDDPFLGPVY